MAFAYFICWIQCLGPFKYSFYCLVFCSWVTLNCFFACLIIILLKTGYFRWYIVALWILMTILPFKGLLLFLCMPIHWNLFSSHCEISDVSSVGTKFGMCIVSRALFHYFPGLSVKVLVSTCMVVNCYCC